MYGTHTRFVSAEAEEEDVVWDQHNSLWPMTESRRHRGGLGPRPAAKMNARLEKVP
jgi:hypothetical protein